MKQRIIKWLSNRLIPIRDVQNGDKVKLILPRVINSWSGQPEENAYNNYEGTVQDVVNGKPNNFTLRSKTSLLVCSPNSQAGIPKAGMVYEMDGKTYRCNKARE